MNSFTLSSILDHMDHIIYACSWQITHILIQMHGKFRSEDRRNKIGTFYDEEGGFKARAGSKLSVSLWHLGIIGRLVGFLISDSEY